MRSDYIWRAPAWMGTPTPGVTYRHYDRGGRLLYVGSSDVHKFEKRQDDHAKGARWWPYVARIEREEHPDRRAAYLAEFAAIREERPVFNRTSKTLAVLQADREAHYLASRSVVASAGSETETEG